MLIIENNKIFEPVYFKVKPFYVGQYQLINNTGKYLIGYWNKLLGNCILGKSLFCLKYWKNVG